MTTAHFEALEVDLQHNKVLDARVGDVVFSGATVQWGAFGRADTAWLFQRLEVVFCEFGVGSDATRCRLRGQLDDDDAVSYLLEWRRGDNPWQRCASWPDLDDARKARCLNELSEVLQAIHGLLIIV